MLLNAMRRLLESEAFEESGTLLIAEMDAAFKEDRSRFVTTASIADAVYSRMFMAISWNLNTGQMRANDPRDFVDNVGIGIGRSRKYGMTDPKEDQATFVAAIVEGELNASILASAVTDAQVRRGGYASADDYLKNTRVLDYVRSELDSGNFEPVVKYLYVASLAFARTNSDGFVCRQPPAVPFSLVARRLRMASPGTVGSVTVGIFHAFDEGSRFASTHCQAESGR